MIQKIIRAVRWPFAFISLVYQVFKRGGKGP